MSGHRTVARNPRKHLLGFLIVLMGFVIVSCAIVREQIRKTGFDVDEHRVITADAEAGNWLVHGRTFDEQRFSPLDQINADNIDQLGLTWTFDTEVGRGHESTPIVIDGMMIFTLPWSIVHALDAKTGEHLWTYDPEVPREWGRYACCDVVNRGGTVWEGKFFFATLDGRLIALDPATGEVIWETLTIDPEQPYTITGAPRVVKDKVLIGNGGAEYGVRGYFTAYDTDTGEEVWRFYTVPGNPDEPFEHPELEAAAETWTGEWWTMGGGGTVWDSMAYDPELDLLYVGTGNGSPWSRKIRSPEGGDNLYLSCILALDPDTGRLVWHYQTTPADNWDYTAVQHMILADLEIDGEMRKLLLQAPKNGFFYVLDRETGELISAEAYVTTTWASHVDLETGRPVETGGDYDAGPKLVLPAPSGGHIWHPMSFSPDTGLVYIPALESSMVYVLKENFQFQPGAWNTGIDFAVSVDELLSGDHEIPPIQGILKAWDPVAGEVAWSVYHPGMINGGVLSTAGNLVFQGSGDGQFSAYKADTGELVWEIETKIGIIAPPISYMVDGEQYIAVLAGYGGSAVTGFDVGISASNTHVNNGRMLVFKLGGAMQQPEVMAKRFLIVPEPPVEVDAAPETLMEGHQLYHQYCFQCHGVAAVGNGTVADLRFSSSAVHRNFDKIVHEGVLSDKGMASFGDVLDEDAIKAIQSYVILRAKQDHDAMTAAPSQ